MNQSEITVRSWTGNTLFARIFRPDVEPDTRSVGHPVGEPVGKPVGERAVRGVGQSDPGSGGPRGVVVISHGYAEHSGRYEGYAEALTAAGWEVHAFDHSGHGKSEGMSGLILRMRHWAYEVGTFVDRARELYPEKPIVVFGQSGGAAAAIRYAAEHQDQIAGIVLSAMYLQNGEPVSPLLVAAARFINLVAPIVPIRPFDAAGISRDPEVVADYLSDPLNYTGNLRVRSGLELIGSYRPVLEAAGSIRIPALFLHGTGDRIASIDAVREVFAKYGSSNKEMKEYDGFFHELHKDIGGERVIRDVVDWLERFPGA